VGLDKVAKEYIHWLSLSRIHEIVVYTMFRQRFYTRHHV